MRSTEKCRLRGLGSRGINPPNTILKLSCAGRRTLWRSLRGKGFCDVFKTNMQEHDEFSSCRSVNVVADSPANCSSFVRSCTDSTRLVRKSLRERTAWCLAKPPQQFNCGVAWTALGRKFDLLVASSTTGPHYPVESLQTGPTGLLLRNINVAKF